MYLDDEELGMDILMHYGVARRSGRYPWGSGENPYQHSGDFLSRVNELKSAGMSEAEIAKAMGLTTTELRVQKSLAKAEHRSLEVATAKSMREHGYSLNEIAAKMGYNNDSSVRALLNSDSEIRMNQAMTTANLLRDQVKEKGMIDVGTGVERELGISKEKLDQALYILEREGYEVYGAGVPQVTNPGRQTNIKVLCPPGTEHKDIYNFDEIHQITDYYSHDGGESFETFHYPKSMDSKRLQIRYNEEGGVDKDGVIEIRRGAEDLDLGGSHYAQVRILVDNKKYLKGMAVYSDDMPDGVDVIFNTNKKLGTPKEDVMKDIKDDPDNPFGSLIKANGQHYYIDKNGEKQLSLINKRAEEGDWGEWSDHLPSQFLSKQPMQLINKQLDQAAQDRIDEYNDICALNNPTVKKHLLNSFADDCDAAAVHLKAAALPRQKYQVILPLTSIKDNEVYAPNYQDGEQVALIRYPHGGTFEIPILTVNNKQPEGRKVLGTNPLDAIGINKKVADRLSGADFDGDTVMVIPVNEKVKIKNREPFEGLANFDNKAEYGTKKVGDQYINKFGKPIKVMNNTQTEMGKISNLITDMTLKGATDSELERAVKHSMVVIDAEKHKLDYKQSEKDNNIKELKKKYQGRYDEDGKYHEGASTLISRTKSKTQVLKRKGSPVIDPETGEKSYKTVTETYLDKNGKTKVRMQDSTLMAETKDARKLSSGTPQEEAYAKYANRMKALGNQARKEMLSTGKIKYDANAKLTYQKEVDSLNAKLNIAEKNAPRERQAQLMANSIVSAKKKEYPDMTKGELKKEKQRALTQCRLKVGAHREPIKITPIEWEAIQHGAISENQLNKIIKHADIDVLRQLATPRAANTLPPAKISKIKAMKDRGYTTEQIANALGVSTSTINKYTLEERRQTNE